jgi:hypothetical protein
MNYESEKQCCGLRMRCFHFAKSIASQALARFEHACNPDTSGQRFNSTAEPSLKIKPEMLMSPISIVPEAAPHGPEASGLSHSSSSTGAQFAKVLWLLPADGTWPREFFSRCMWVGDGKMSEANLERDPHEKSEENKNQSAARGRPPGCP